MARATRSRRTPRRKTMRRKMSMRRPLRNRYGQGKIYAFKRTCELRPFNYQAGIWVQSDSNVVSNYSGGTNYRGIFKFKLTDLPGYTDFTNLYENFRITGVRLRFLPYLGTESTAPASTGSVMSPLAICIDRGANDAVGVNPSFTQLLENQDVKIRSSYKPFSMYIAYPKSHAPADGLTQTVLMTPWLDSEVNGEAVDHHGLKFCFQDNTTNDRQVAFRVYATYYIKCRAPQ